MEVVLDMPFLILSNANILFAKQKLIWRLHILAKTLGMTKRMEIINQKKCLATALNLSKEVFVIHMTYLGSKISIYLACETQIALLVVKKITILVKYLDYLNVF